MLISGKIAKLFKFPGFVCVDYLVRNKIYVSPSVILNVLTRDWRRWRRPKGFENKRLKDILDPNFGYETAGASTKSIAFGGIPIIPEYPTDTRAGTAWTMPEDGTAQSITAYLGGDAECDVKALINQKDSAGANSHDEVAQKENLSVSATAHWETFTLDTPVDLTGGVDYILNVIGDGGSVGAYNLFYVYYDENGVTSYQETDRQYSSPEDPWTVSPESTPKKYSIYCTYTTVVPIKIIGDGLTWVVC